MFPQWSNSKSVNVCFHFLFWLTTFFVVQISLTMFRYLDSWKKSSNIDQANYLFCPFLCDHCTHKDLRRVNLKEREPISRKRDWEGESVKVTHFCLVFFTFFCKHAQAHQNKVISVKNSSISLVCRDVSKYNRDPNHKTTPVGSAWINWNAKMAQMINTRSISRKDLDCD